MSDRDYDYVAVGHVTCDLLVDGGKGTRQPGGTAFYSALQAARLGLRTLILTQGVPAEVEELLAPYRDELDLHAIAAAKTTTLSTAGVGAGRSQRMLSWAGPMADLPAIDARILHWAPIAKETPVSWAGEAGFVGVTAQGLVRDWPDGEIQMVALDGAVLPDRFDVAVISEHELHACDALFATAHACGACVAVTAGSAATTLHTNGGTLKVPAAHVPDVRDELGAGDVFAAALFVALAEGREPVAAATFAHAASAVRIAGQGPGAIGTRARIEALTP
ncbi:MAG: PfkB family carbohydrate kinase [Solirubrobacteraceae bacterium]